MVSVEQAKLGQTKLVWFVLARRRLPPRANEKRLNSFSTSWPNVRAARLSNVSKEESRGQAGRSDWVVLPVLIDFLLQPTIYDFVRFLYNELFNRSLCWTSMVISSAFWRSFSLRVAYLNFGGPSTLLKNTSYLIAVLLKHSEESLFKFNMKIKKQNGRISMLVFGTGTIV